MTPPDDLRILIEAAFPGAVVESGDGIGGWCIRPASPIAIGDLLIATITCDSRGRVGAYRIALTASAIQAVGRGRVVVLAELEQRMRSSAHEILAARRRLGL
ncbi:MAG TPA: hypothetical protein PKA33_16050 [Amaricoccus sp.]|uniref:hypothetical protein n=1 Tax=Amaricoccus sp. TaxID=1872485 RepID=UPI002CA5FE15|nr:hypothetical protein [Amaricoccus sp.]HMQ92485.1 hypothetical protein [Amaricoccus sp.]HMR53866.1 hypothetical protein [Amaricoccus sp.]HMR58983.1 hypothetical protein [Amaricoccus sp.]HMU00861.1 hypothetical protein [Amaricoccus sp.]